MGSVSDCMTATVVCLYIGYVGVSAFICTHGSPPWLLAEAWTPGLCRASAWGVICPGVSGLWDHGWICLGVDGCRRGLWARRWGICTVAAGWFPWDFPLLFSGGVAVFRQWFSWGSCALGGLWMSVAGISSVSVPGPGGQVCGSSHSLLHIFMEKPCIYKHPQTHRCLDSGVNRYTNVLY
ncbi:hypothetical protein ATANTOWER_028936 [Ataeniobius toweri]|uniref:Uncharacterized protein n=1 Tax=Ataeniobius toweri TaxID=208326 RepID=A0ABU7BAF0_9TELE|nr:hypothetical protein [Ataeniobius toweri]